VSRVLDWVEKRRVAIGSIFSILLLAVGGLLAWLDWHPPKSEIVTSREVIKQATTTTTTASAATSSASSASTQGKIININTATASELDSLPGIGTTYAQRIIDYRQQYGAFKSTHDLVKVKGIGEGTYSKLQSLVTVGE